MVDSNKHIAVIDALLRFANGMDTNDDELIASAFAKDAIIDFTPAGAKVGMTFPVVEGRDAAKKVLGPFAKAFITSHSVTNARVSFDGDIACLYALVEAQHFPEGGDGKRHFLMKNRYDVSLVLVGNNWQITKMLISNLWSEGDVGIMSGE